MGQKEDPPTNLSNHGRKGRASSPLVKYLEMGVFFPEAPPIYLLLESRWLFFRVEGPRFSGGKKVLSARRKISVRTKINFLICGNVVY